MNRKVLITLALLISFGPVFCKNVLAWDDKVTHKDLSEYAAEISTLSKDKGDCLKNIGFNSALDEYIAWDGGKKKISQWLRTGAEAEDAGSDWDAITGKARFSNHFHNPLKPWALAGLTDLQLQSGESTLVWAQDADRQRVSLGGDWSWKTIREFFYIGLTGKNFLGNLIAPTNDNKQEYLAKTFRGLGHQMHLIEDMAVPAHVRNDAHPLDAKIGKNGYGYYFETWTKKKIGSLSALKSFASVTAVNNSMPQLVFSTLTDTSLNISLAPLANLFDTNQYNGTNPSTANTIGLAEYTNANYFSDDTINLPGYTKSSEFPYPNASNTDIQSYILQEKLSETVTAEDGDQDTSFWIKKIGTDGIAEINHFARPGYLTEEANSSVYHLTFHLDDQCHEDYAKLLLPRAVGYSAALLDYFFRGNVTITLPVSGYYAIGQPEADGFTRINLLAQNTTSTGEDMSDGSIELVVKYKLALEDPFQPISVDTDEEFSYKVVSETNNTRTIPKNSPVELTFNLGQNSLPLWATDVYLQVVYHGKLGNEDGAVAVGFKDISEPTPVDLYNNMDNICLFSTWYSAGSQTAITIIDAIGNHNGKADEWDVYPHDVRNAYLKISPAGNETNASPSFYTFPTGTIPPGTLYRAFLLSDYDYPFNYSNYSPAVATTTDDTADHAEAILIERITGSAIKNQVDFNVTDQAICDEIEATAPCDIRTYPNFYPFRGKNIWGAVGIIVDNPKFPTNTSCSWELLQ